MNNANDKIVIEVTRTVTFKVAVRMDYDYADNGHKFVVASDYSIDTDSLLNSAEAALDIEQPEFRKVEQLGQEADDARMADAMKNVVEYND